MKVSGTVVVCKFITLDEKIINDCFFDRSIADVRKMAKDNNMIVVKCTKKKYEKEITISQLNDNLSNDLRSEVMGV